MQFGPRLAGAAHAGDSTPVTARGLLDAVPDAIMVLDVRGDVVDANPAASSLFGHAHEALCRLNLRDLCPVLPSGHVRHVMEVCGVEEAFTVETTVRRRDGREVPVEMRWRLLHQPDGSSCIVCATRDVGHWHRTANRLREAEQRDRLLLDSMDKGVVVRNGEGRITYMNPAACRIFRISASELPQIENQGFAGWRFTDSRGQVMTPKDFPSIRALETGVAVASELVCFWLPHVKTPLWMTISATPLFHNDEDHPYQVVTTLEDVSDLKRTQDLLEQTQMLGSIGGFELIVETGQLVWTREMYRLFDLSQDFPITLDRVLALFAPDSRQRIERDLANAGKGKQVGKQEYEIVTMLGRRRWISAVASLVWRGSDIACISGTCQDITERKLLEQKLRRKAVTDPLTGLANREYILHELDRQIAAARGGIGPSLLYVDLDRFKVINSMLGAEVGDHLLANAALRLQGSLPATARCGRFAGDEFLVVLPGNATMEPAHVAEAINDAFQRPFEHEGEEFMMTVSVGVATCPADGTDAQQLLKHADAAMDEAKLRGRSTWQAFSPAIATRLRNNLALVSQLHNALALGQLRLVYQPQVTLADDNVYDAEALLRWDHPQRGELGPLEFIHHAEGSGDIVPIGAWAIDEACRQLCEWRTAGLPLRRMAVNVSYRQLLSETFVESVRRSLRRHGVPGDCLELEMIERMLIDDTPDTLQVFQDLRDAGVVITIDDFGEGYSALNYLRRLPIDGFKISYDFMRRVPANQADTAICEAIIRVGQALGLTIVAEGVETEAQREFLLRNGMHAGQGHLFSGALGPAAFAEHVRAHGGDKAGIGD